jgi:hypothetical protein
VSHDACAESVCFIASEAFKSCVFKGPSKPCLFKTLDKFCPICFPASAVLDVSSSFLSLSLSPKLGIPIDKNLSSCRVFVFIQLLVVFSCDILPVVCTSSLRPNTPVAEGLIQQ